MQTQTKPSFIFLFLLIAFGSITAVDFTPGLPQISQDFGVTAAQAGWTISLFLIGYTFGQLIYGPLANRYGRKRALYLGISLEIMGSLLCAFSENLHTFQLLIWSRLVMALGAGVGLKMSFTLVAESYAEIEAKKLTAHLLSAFAITPPMGVAIGGFLVQYFSWTATFYFTAIYGLVLFLLTLRVSETAKNLDLDALKISKILTKYAAVLKTIKLPLAAMLMGSCTALIYIFAALAPFIAMEMMGLTPSTYGLWNLVPIIGMLLGSQISARYSHKLSAINLITLGILCAFISIIVMILAFKLGYILSVFLFIPAIVTRMGANIVYASASHIAMTSSEDKSNTSAMMSFLNMSVATFSVLSLSFFHKITAMLLPLTYAGLMVFATVLTLLLARNIQ